MIAGDRTALVYQLSSLIEISTRDLDVGHVAPGNRIQRVIFQAYSADLPNQALFTNDAEYIAQPGTVPMGLC